MRFRKVELAKRCHSFTKIRSSAQLANSFLPKDCLFDGGSVEQIIGQATPANGGSGDAKHLEKRTFTDDIQVGGIDMIRLTEFFTGDSGMGPLAIHPLDRALIKALEAPHAGFRLTCLPKTPHRN